MKKTVSEVFYLFCWIVFPIGLPLLAIIHFHTKNKERNEFEDSIKNRSTIYDYPNSIEARLDCENPPIKSNILYFKPRDKRRAK